MRPSLTTLNSTFGMLSPADGISAARNKRDSACPADGSAARLHHIRGRGHGRFWQIVLQKSKVEGTQIFRKKAERKSVTDSYDLNRITEVACELS